MSNNAKPKTGTHAELQRAHYLATFTPERIYELYWTMRDGAELDQATRSDIIRALGCFADLLRVERDLRARGRRIKFENMGPAALVNILHNDYGVMVKVAVRTVLPDADEKAHATLASTYRAMKRGTGFGQISIPKKVLQHYVDRLPIRKSGNK